MQAVADIQKFVIISIPRTGSNLLVGALDSHPEIICHYELFHKKAIYTSGKYGKEWINKYSLKLRNNDPMVFLEFVNRHTFNKTVKTIGFKIFQGQNDKLLNILIEDKSWLKIILKRNNYLLNYVSKLEALKTGKYVSRKKHENTGKDITVKVKFRNFNSFVRNGKHFYNRIEQKLQQSGQDYYQVEYVNILSLKNRRNILRFLNVDPDPEYLKEVTVKQNKRKLEDRISNYGKIKKLFVKHGYNEYLQDV